MARTCIIGTILVVTAIIKAYAQSPMYTLTIETNDLYRLDCRDMSATSQIMTTGAYYGSETEGCQDNEAYNTFLSGCHGERYCDVEKDNFVKCDDLRRRQLTLILDYYCVEPSGIVAICDGPGVIESKTYTLQSDSDQIFIMTPNFPNNYKARQDCNLTVFTSAPSRTKVYLYYMDLEYRRDSTGGCYDFVRIWDTVDMAITVEEYCGRSPYSPQPLGNVERWIQPAMFEENIVFSFHSDSSVTANGFIFMIEVTAVTGPCSNVDCGQHGQCILDDVTPVCDCDDGWTGEFCREQVSTTPVTSRDVITTSTMPDSSTGTTPFTPTSSPITTTPEGGESTTPDLCDGVDCGHGTCGLNGDENKDVYCACLPGWQGPNCDRRNLCHQYDCERGTCVVKSGVAKCNCDAGWTGEHCDDEDVCYNYDCGRGTCFINSGFPACDCDDGWTGINCDEVLPVSCANYTCGYGHCLEEDEQPVCVCFVGWKGEHCDKEDMCHGFICERGTCMDDLGIPACKCPKGWTGKYCGRKTSGGATTSMCVLLYIATVLASGLL